VKLLLAFLIALGASQAQEPKKKPAVKQKAHAKPTPEQIRKFNQLEKKQQK
jgi:hypothetical protein